MTETRVDIRPDPRISNQRPGWLTDDTAWRDQLQAMDLDDVRWIERHWENAGGTPPAVDTSWVTTETIGGRVFGVDSVFWPIATLVVGIVVCFGGAMLVGGGQ